MKNKYLVVLKSINREIVEADCFDWTIASVEFSTASGALVAAFNSQDVSYVIPYEEEK